MKDVEAYLALYAFLLVLILFHEAGHLVAGFLCSFRVVKFRVGLVEWRLDYMRPKLDGPKWHLSRHWKHLLSGEVSAFATERSIERLRLRYFAFILAGPMANFTCAMLAFPIALERTTAGGLAKYFILGSVLFGFINLIPLNSRELKSDGFKIWKLLFNRTKRDDLLYWLTVPARLNEISVLWRTGNAKHACEKADEFIRMSKKLPSVMANEEYRQRLIKFEADFQELVNRGTNMHGRAPDFEAATTLNIVPSDYGSQP